MNSMGKQSILIIGVINNHKINSKSENKNQTPLENAKLGNLRHPWVKPG